MDIVLRLRSRDRARWLLNREAGGHLLYIPVWIFGLVVVAANLARAAQA
jgi:hypothetical protein